MSSFPIPRPRSDDGTILPAVLVGVLTVTLALQLALTSAGEPEPDDTPVRAAVGRSVAVPPFRAAVADPAIRARPIFAPNRSGSTSGGASDPLAGAQVAGSWSVGRQTILVLRLADGRTRNLRVGQSVNRWVLAAVAADGARFVHDGKRIVVPFGGTAPQATATDDPPAEEEQ